MTSKLSFITTGAIMLATLLTASIAVMAIPMESAEAQTRARGGDAETGNVVVVGDENTVDTTATGGLGDSFAEGGAADAATGGTSGAAEGDTASAFSDDEDAAASARGGDAETGNVVVVGNGNSVTSTATGGDGIATATWVT